MVIHMQFFVGNAFPTTACLVSMSSLALYRILHRYFWQALIFPAIVFKISYIYCTIFSIDLCRMALDSITNLTPVNIFIFANQDSEGGGDHHLSPFGFLLLCWIIWVMLLMLVHLFWRPGVCESEWFIYLVHQLFASRIHEVDVCVMKCQEYFFHLSVLLNSLPPHKKYLEHFQKV